MAERRNLQAALTSDDEGLAFVFGNKKASTEEIEAVVAQVPQQSVPTALIHTSFTFAPNKQPYRHFYDQAQIESWAEGEIAKNGIRSALWVRSLPNQSGEYELIAGMRRLIAAKALGLPEVPVRIFELDDASAYQAMRAENRDREEPTPLEDLDGTLNLLAIRLGRSILDVISLLYRMDNEARGKVAKQTVLGSPDAKVVEEVFADSGVSWQSFLSSRLRLLKLPSEILDSIRESKLQYTKALEVAKVKDSEIRQRLLEEATSQNLSTSDIKLRVRKINTNKLGEPNVTSRLNEAYKRIKKSKALENPKNLKILQKIIDQMEMLVEEN
jgi:ParB family transcriptional regulator, chromosome partitioning protein